MKLKVIEMGLTFAGLVTAMGCATAIVQEWLKSKRFKPEGSHELLSRLDEMGERLARLENATDAVALEVERISEGQRFTTKLLADRTQTTASS